MNKLNFKVGIMKYKPIHYLFTVVLNFLFIQTSFCKSQIKMYDIKVIYNLDSMVMLLPSFNKISTEYINLLITIERNRQWFNSDKEGDYYKEIDSLSRKIGYTFGEGFANYSYSHLGMIKTFDEIKSPALQALKAMNQFYSIKDYSGVYYSSILYIKNFSNYLAFISKNKLENFNENKPINLVSCLKDSVKIHLKFVNDYSITFGTRRDRIAYFKLLADINTRFAKTKENNFQSKNYLDSAIQFANLIPKQNDLLNSLFYAKARIYLDDSDYDDAKTYFLLTLNTIPNEESSLKYLALQKIGTLFYERNLLDSSLFYFKKSLTEPFITVGDKQRSLDNIANLYLAKKDYVNAFEYKSLANETLIKLSEESYNAQINSYKDFEKIKNQEIKNNQLLAYKKTADLKLLFSIVTLLFLSSIITIVAILYKRLANSKKSILQLQTSRENFYSIVAHDLRSHVNSYQDMAGMVSYLIKEKKYTQIEKIAFQIDKTGLLLKNLLQNLFQWSLSQKEHLAFNIESVNVKDCIDQVTLTYSPIAEAKNIQINISIDKDHQIKTDKNHFTTILRNLIDNAIKNSNTGTSVSIVATSETNILKLSVQNISNLSDEKFNIIQSLFASQKEWQVGEHGMGLGLILIKEFTKKMNGYVEVQKENEVISFELSFPIQDR